MDTRPGPSPEKGTSLTRRDFVKTVAPAAAFTVLPHAVARGSAANSALSVGIIGCGWRGNHLVGKLKELEGANARVVALADPFRDQLEATRERYPNDDPALYQGLEAYRQVVNSDVDLVFITSPPYFHPEHLEAAVEAGRHVYLEKPVAVDTYGARRVRELGERARGKQTILVGFQSRSRADLQKAVGRIHGGAIGRLVTGTAHYNAGPMSPKDVSGLAPLEQRLRNWVWDKALSGDILVEQNIHVLDICNWAFDAHPTRAYASAARSVRTHWGDTNDNYQVIFWYPENVRLTYSGTQYLNLPWGDSEQRIHGVDGAFENLGWYAEKNTAAIRGKRAWAYSGAIHDPEMVRLKTLVDSIRSGDYLIETDSGAESTLTAILGKLAAERGREITWEMMMRENQRIDAGVS